MIEARINIQQLEPEADKAMFGMEAYLGGTGLGRRDHRD